MDPRCRGHFQNEPEGVGYNAVATAPVRGIRIFGLTLCEWIEKQMFRFELSEDTPLTFIQDNGDQIRPCLPGASFPSDLGSIPLLVQRYIRKESVEFFFHDRAYSVGYLWVRAKGTTIWRAVAVSRWDADLLLYTMSQCTKDPRGRAKASLIWVGVFSGGWACGYRKSRKPLPDSYSSVPERPDVDDPPIGM